jgi:hypothetical protein
LGVGLLFGFASSVRGTSDRVEPDVPPADAPWPANPACPGGGDPAGSWGPWSPPIEGRWLPYLVPLDDALIVWGGQTRLGDTRSGERIDPDSLRHVAMSTDGAVEGGVHQAAVATPHGVFVWISTRHEGAIYDPAADRWRRVSAENAPRSVGVFRAVWTGRVVLVWGGVTTGDHNECAAYDPAADRWRGVIAPREQTARTGSTVVWTGQEMIVWGGSDATFATGPVRNDGWRYNPERDVWSSVSLANAPSPRTSHVAVWTGREMIVWGGHRNTAPSFSEGARYDPVTDTWRPMRRDGAPSGSPSQYPSYQGVWTGTDMVVWSEDPRGWTPGARYDPALDRWTALATRGAPDAREGARVAWVRCSLVAWGGRRFVNGRYEYVSSGARWRP